MSSELQGKRVLLVDDHTDSLELLELLLQGAGADVQTAECGLDAFALATARVPDVIVSDIGLPDIDGYELLRRLRAQESTSRVAVVALTGYSDSKERGDFQKVLIKPVERLALINAVASAVFEPVPG